MTIYKLFTNLRPYVKKYRLFVIATLILTFIGSFAAQVNALILRYTVDSITEISHHADKLQRGWNMLLFISGILFAKEIIGALVQFGQKFYGEKLRILVSQDLSQSIIVKILTYRLSFFTAGNNESGKLQTRIDRGVESLTRLVQNFFIDIIPLFANAIVALALMFQANFYVGLVGLVLVPIYFLITQHQAGKLSGWRRTMRS